jgi:drug/metabolite transporter (DMT)-like permease
MTVLSVTGIIVCTIFMFVGPSLIMVNQYILKYLHFPYPILLSALGVVASGLTARILVQMGYFKLQRAEAVEGVLWYKRVLPVGFCSAATLAFGNLVYLYLDVGFIQMLKSFVPVILMATGYVFGIETISSPVFIAVMIISIGTAATCTASPELHIIGLFVMFGAEFFESIRLVLTQFFLQDLKFSVIESQYILSPACFFWLFLLACIFELPQFLEQNAITIVFENLNWFIFAAALGVGVNFITYFVIQFTSSLTMKILGTVRNICLVFVGVIFYGENITTNQFLGYSIALVGFAGYNAAKMNYFDNSPYVRQLDTWVAQAWAFLGVKAKKPINEVDEEELELLA